MGNVMTDTMEETVQETQDIRYSQATLSELWFS